MEWMLEKWNIQRRKGYLKIHLAVDVRAREYYLWNNDEHKQDSRVLAELVDNISKQKGKKITKVLADGTIATVFFNSWQIEESCHA